MHIFSACLTQCSCVFAARTPAAGNGRLPVLPPVVRSAPGQLEADLPREEAPPGSRGPQLRPARRAVPAGPVVQEAGHEEGEAGEAQEVHQEEEESHGGDHGRISRAILIEKLATAVRTLGRYTGESASSRQLLGLAMACSHPRDHRRFAPGSKPTPAHERSEALTVPCSCQ